MAKSTASIGDILDYIFLATAVPWAANGSFYLALHTADPGVGGNQQTSEATYTGYARVAVVRTASGWDTVTTSRKNHALLQFPKATGGTNTITHISVGTVDTGGAGEIIYSGALNSSLSVSTNIQPQFAAQALVVSET